MALLEHLLVPLMSFALDAVSGLDVALGVNTIPRALEKERPAKSNYFVELLGEGIYVDKTLMIDAFLSHSEPVIAITCPKKWGKTTNLHMLKTFLEIQVHPNGTKILPVYSTQNYQLFTKGVYRSQRFNIKLENPLLISKEKYHDKIEKYLGRFPVIRVSFGGGAPTTATNFTAVLGRVIAKAFNEHKYLLNVYDRVQEEEGHEIDERERFVRYMKNRAHTEEELLNGIKFLCQELFYYMREDVYLLIDDYERYVDPKEKNVIQYFYKTTLDDNKFLKKTLLTGLLATEIKYRDDANYNEFLDIPNAFYYEFLVNAYFYPFYGYTLDEMRLVYKAYRIDHDEQNHLAYWYGGYRTPEDAGVRIYNPWSINEYMNSQRELPYWINETARYDHHLDQIFELADFQYVFTRLLIGQDYDVGGMQTRFYLIFINSALDVNTCIAYMLTAGYLTPVKTFLWEGVFKRISTVRIPNQEIAAHLQEIFQTKLQLLYERSAYERLLNTSDLFEQFLKSDQLTSPQLEERFNSSGIATKKDLVHHMVLLAITANTLFEFVNRPFEHLWPNETAEIGALSDILMSSYDRGFIINVQQANESDGVSAIELYTPQSSVTFQKYAKFHFWKQIKLVDCKITTDNTFQIKSVIHTFQDPERWRTSERTPFEDVF